MGAFLGYNDVGVWASNSERDAFLDWFAAHRCADRDARWQFCMSEGNRWTGCCIELGELIARGEPFEVTEAERRAAAIAFWPVVSELLGVICMITRGEWQWLVSSTEAVRWRAVKLDDVDRQRRFDAVVEGPPTTSSFGADVTFLRTDDPRRSGE